jgi:hypothetical protein
VYEKKYQRKNSYVDEENISSSEEQRKVWTTAVSDSVKAKVTNLTGNSKASGHLTIVKSTTLRQGQQTV